VGLVVGATVIGVILAVLSDHHALGPVGVQVLVALAYGVLLLWSVLLVTARHPSGG
jgi:hypothetical protein